MKVCAFLFIICAFCNVLNSKGLNFQSESDVTILQVYENKTLSQQRNYTDCVCPYSYECYWNDLGEPGCKCPAGKIEVGVGIYGEFSCVDCDCPSSHECVLNNRRQKECRCPDGTIEKNEYGENTCLYCNCHHSFDCILNDQGQTDCICPGQKVELHHNGEKFCVACNCPESYECILINERETDCKCLNGKLEKEYNGQKVCLDCNCPKSHECFLNDQEQVDCRCPEGKIKKDENGENICLDCNCHSSQECFLNDLGFPDCRCSSGQIETEEYGVKFCLDCNCRPTQECFANERGLADCKCASGKIEKVIHGEKTCIDCDCGDGICVLDANNIKKCHCGSKQVKSADGKCYECDCGLGTCSLNENNSKNCHCGSGQVKGENGKCYECDCGAYGLCEFHASGKKCTCAPFTLELNGKCTECNCGSHGLCSFESGHKKCVCSPYSVEIDGKCVVIESSTPVTTDSSSLLSTILSSTIPECYCGSNSKSCSLDLDGSKNCTCYSGYSQIDGYCAECNCGPYGECTFEFGQKKCDCKQFAIEMNGLCIVIESTSSKGTTDSMIRTSAIFSSTAQDCDCGENSKSCHFDSGGEKVCNCYSGYAQIRGFCYVCDCGPHGSCIFESDQKRCVCKQYAIELNGRCIAIKSTTIEGTTNSTIMKSTIYPSTIQECYCGENANSCYFNSKGNKVCNCNPGFSEDDGYCYECDCGPRGKCTFEFKQKKCICDLYTSVKNEKCTDCNCGVNSQLCYFRRDGTKVCKCNFGYTEVDGHCVAICNDDKCVNGICKIVDNGYQCRCNDGFTGLRCESKIGAKPYTQDIWQFIPAFVLISICILLFFGILFFKVCFKC